MALVRVFFARNTTQVFLRVVCCNGSKINKLQISQFPGGGLFDCHRWRPLWLSLTMTSMFHQMASRSIIVHHLDIVGMPNRFCHSVNHRLLGENTRARSMFSMLCAVECQVSKFCWSSATEDLFVQWWSCKIGFWCWQLVALTDSRFMADESPQTFIVCLLAILLCPIISKRLQRLVRPRGGSIRTDLDGTLITMMGVQEKVGRVDLSGDPAFAPQNPNTPLGEQDPQMFIFAIPRTVIAVRFKVGADLSTYLSPFYSWDCQH